MPDETATTPPKSAMTFSAIWRKAKTAGAVAGVIVAFYNLWMLGVTWLSSGSLGVEVQTGSSIRYPVDVLSKEEKAEFDTFTYGTAVRMPNLSNVTQTDIVVAVPVTGYYAIVDAKNNIRATGKFPGALHLTQIFPLETMELILWHRDPLPEHQFVVVSSQQSGRQYIPTTAPYTIDLYAVLFWLLLLGVLIRWTWPTIKRVCKTAFAMVFQKPPDAPPIAPTNVPTVESPHVEP